jgi:hypothetical protein
MKLTGENRSTRRKPVPVPLRPSQIPHGLNRDASIGLWANMGYALPFSRVMNLIFLYIRTL